MALPHSPDRPRAVVVDGARPPARSSVRALVKLAGSPATLRRSGSPSPARNPRGRNRSRSRAAARARALHAAVRAAVRDRDTSIRVPRRAGVLRPRGDA